MLFGFSGHSTFCTSYRTSRAPRLCTHKRSDGFRVSPRACFDPYKELGVSRSADEAAIKRAYRKAALERHPDVSKAPDAQESFQRAQDAYRMLSDRKSRSDYDRVANRASSGYSSTGAPFGDDGAAAREYARKWRKANPMPEDLEDDIGSVLSDLFGGMRNAAAERGPSVLNDVMDFLERGAGIGGGTRSSSVDDDLDRVLRSKSADVLEAEMRECDRAEKEAINRASGADDEVRKLETREAEWKKRAARNIPARTAAQSMVDEIQNQKSRLEARARSFREAAEATRLHRERVKKRLEEVQRNEELGDNDVADSQRKKKDRGMAVEEELERMKREIFGN